MICSSLYFEKGSQQEKHFDTFFMAPLIRDRMLATWIALEDVTEENGPLFYYPGSHRIAPYRFENGRFNLNPSEKSDCYEYIDAELEKREIKREYFLAEKGDLFIWHAQLLHGGASIRDSDATRRSLVTHYFCRQDHDAAECEEFSSGMFYLKREYLKPGDFDEESHQYI
jgi:ectoine hydroxylase-related dioxygenase (phytanoyl-CoA dioxygenase family)